jgi:hypothetical protein
MNNLGIVRPGILPKETDEDSLNFAVKPVLGI